MQPISLEMAGLPRQLLPLNRDQLHERHSSHNSITLRQTWWISMKSKEMQPRQVKTTFSQSSHSASYKIYRISKSSLMNKMGQRQVKLKMKLSRYTEMPSRPRRQFAHFMASNATLQGIKSRLSSCKRRNSQWTHLRRWALDDTHKTPRVSYLDLVTLNRRQAQRKG